MHDFMLFIFKDNLIEVLNILAKTFGRHKWQCETSGRHVIEFRLLCDHLNHFNYRITIKAKKIQRRVGLRWVEKGGGYLIGGSRETLTT